MKQISNTYDIKDIQPTFFKEKGVDKITNARQLIIKDFLDKLNSERVGTKYPPLTARAVSIKLSHLSEFDLQFFYKKCDTARSFGQVFFGALKSK